MLNKENIEQYFIAEKKAGLVFMLIGLAGVLLSLFFFFCLKIAFYKGAAIPPFLIGLVITAVGYTVYKRSDGDRIKNVYAYDMNPSALFENELPRMKQVMANFKIYKYAELVLLLTGAALYIFFIRDIKHDFWRGLGLTLAVMSLLTLTGDYFAGKRGDVYYRNLKDFSAKS